MPTSTQSPDLAPPAAQGRPGQVTVSQDGRVITISGPHTREEISALISQRESISEQLNNVSDRRHELSQELQGTADPVARSGLEDRIRVLDQRILQLENDLGATGRQLATAPPDLVATTGYEMSPPDRGDVFPEGVALGAASALVFCALVYGLTRRRWRRHGARSQQGALTDDSAQRLQRLEHGMEAIAIEIERVSEGQRFVTKLLSESQQPVPASSTNAPPLAIEQKSIKG